MKLDLSKIDPRALRDVREAVQDGNIAQEPEAVDAYIAGMTSEIFLDYYLRWNGIIGFTVGIIQALDSVREAQK